jgi:hypothetical protein
VSGPLQLSAARAAIVSVTNNRPEARDVYLPMTSIQNGDIIVVVGATLVNPINIKVPAAGGAAIVDPNGGAVTISVTGQQYRFIVDAVGNFVPWTRVSVDTHTHAASDITSGTLVHERGGLEADVSAYNGLVKIASGSTSAVTVTSAGEALLDDADASAQRTTLGLGTAAVEAATAFAASGSITTSGLTQATARILGRTTASTGAVEEIQIGSGLSLSAGELSATGSGVTAVGASTADVLSVSGSDLVADDPNADRIVFYDDSEGKWRYLEAGSGLSISGTTLTATATGTIGGGTGSTDNSILRSDGTGGSTLQASGLVIEDTVTAFTGITGDAGTDIITATGSAFANGQRVRFTSLTGGAGLNTTTNYFVINASGATFQLSTTDGGSASLFTTNITAGTLLTGHAVQTLVRVSNVASDTNSALVLSPKGGGAFVLGPQPDASSSGGNARGVSAVELQMVRTSATAVASGERAFIGGGANNTGSGPDSVCCGGTGNTASGFLAGIFSGRNNTASGDRSMAAGDGNTSSNTDSFAVGWNNTASAVQSVAIGTRAVADRQRLLAHSSGFFAASGDAQRIRAVLRCKTTTNAAVEMALDGSATYLTIPSGKVIFCNIKVVGVKSDGSVVATYERQYAAKNVAGTSSEVFAPVTIGTDNASSTSLEVATVDAGDYIRIRPTGITSETWRWVASVDAVEVAYGT